MKTIWKYELKTDNQVLQMPKGAQILTVQIQNEIPCLWVLVNPEAEHQPRAIEIFGTGHDIEEYTEPEVYKINRKYIGTYQLRGGAFIAHVFERLSHKPS